VNGAIVLRAGTLEATGLVRAVFTTRQGGVGAGPHRSLNLSYAVGDRAAAVTENRRRAFAAIAAAPDSCGRVRDAAYSRSRKSAAAFGVSAARLVEAQQVHGREVAVVDHRHAGRTIRGVDALITASRRIWLAVHTADCVPVLILDPGRPAAAAVHAGWRGVAAGVVPAAMGRLQTVCGTVPARCRVALGPAIGGCCYEVDAPVAQAMGGAPWWPTAAQPGGPGRWYLDLRRAVVAQLADCGVPLEHIETIPACTRCQPDVFFSYRRERATGRMAACIRLCEGPQRE
jgi:polyphenol oxidase